MSDPLEKNIPAQTQKIHEDELRKILGHPDVKPSSDGEPSDDENGTEQNEKSNAE